MELELGNWGHVFTYHTEKANKAKAGRSAVSSLVTRKRIYLKMSFLILEFLQLVVEDGLM